MAVLKNRRGLSKMEFSHNARKMRKEITELLLRDFSIHSRKARKSGQGGEIPEGYYDEIIDEFSRNIRLLLRNLMLNITAGNTIYPVNLSELQTRRQYQTAAIIACEQLEQEFMYCEDILPVKASVFAPYVEQIEFEIKLLKGWRKANNRLEEVIIAKQQGREEKE